MTTDVTLEEQRRLVKNIQKWARILDESAAALYEHPNSLLSLSEKYDFKDLTKDQLREIRTAVFSVPTNAHLISICLRQLDEHARELENAPLWTGEIAQKGSMLRALIASEEIRDLRNVVEHGAEYLAGKGRKSKLVQDPEADWPSVQLIDKKVTKIAVFGCEYFVEPMINAAIDFAKILNEKTST